MVQNLPSALCPRCSGFIPTNANPGKYPGALSRFDNATEICSDCGTEEALLLLCGPENWPVFMYDFPEERTVDARQRAVDAFTLSSMGSTA
jgi:hypothetical protein